MDRFTSRINNPVFANTSIIVYAKLRYIVMPGIGRGHDFNDPVRRAYAATGRDLVRVAYNRNIRFKYCVLSLMELYSEWSGIGAALSPFRFDIVFYDVMKFAGYILVFGAGSRHIDDMTIDQFRMDIIRQIIEVLNGIIFFLWQWY